MVLVLLTTLVTGLFLAWAPWLVRRAGAAASGEPDPEERAALLGLMRRAADAVPAPPDPGDGRGTTTAHMLALLEAQRDALLDARDDGRFDSSSLSGALAAVDADQIALDLKGAPVS